MVQNNLNALLHSVLDRSYLIILACILVNLLFNIVANASFKLSADSTNWHGFLSWQVIGNLAGLITVLSLTALLRFLPLSLAFPLTTGLMVIGVQIVASRWLFNEQISLERWVGSLLVVGGIWFLSAR
jgi:multidrug transporter EmrE-like cation transporter